MIAAVIGAVLFGMTAILYILLLLGVPLGEYAMGGKYKVIPRGKRIVIVIAILIQLFGIYILLQAGGVIGQMLPISIIKTTCYVYSIYLTLNILMNAVSRSKKEQRVMTPLSLATATCFWIVTLGL